MTSKRSSGFTLIELLVVIVVIGILATISIVTFSGIQRRASGVQIAAAAKQWDQQFKLYYALNGSYDDLVTPAGCQPMLGRSATEFADLSPCNNTFNQTVIDELKTASGESSLPMGRLPNIRTSFHGIRYIGLGTKRLQFVQPGTKCPDGAQTGVYTPSIDAVLCEYYLE